MLFIVSLLVYIKLLRILGFELQRDRDVESPVAVFVPWYYEHYEYYTVGCYVDGFIVYGLER
jgi:hypothetical protein